MIEPVNTVNMGEYNGRTCVWIAYKAFQLDELGECLVEFSLVNIDPTRGTIAVIDKESFSTK